MIRLSQRDPKWCKKNLGLSKLTIGRFGCTSTAISMLSDYFGCYIDPGAIASNVHYYTPEGLIIWKNLSFNKFKFESRDYSENDARIKEYLKDPNKAVILEVNYGSHWVVCVHDLGNNDYIVADPWLGRDVDVKSIYHNISGAAYFIKS